MESACQHARLKCYKNNFNGFKNVSFSKAFEKKYQHLTLFVPSMLNTRYTIKKIIPVN